ncbi:hypothetical protein [Thauera humireducens]
MDALVLLGSLAVFIAIGVPVAYSLAWRRWSARCGSSCRSKRS